MNAKKERKKRKVAYSPTKIDLHIEKEPGIYEKSPFKGNYIMKREICILKETGLIKKSFFSRIFFDRL